MKKFFDSRWYQVLRRGSETYAFPCAAAQSARVCGCTIECKWIAKKNAFEKMMEPCQGRELRRTISGVPPPFTREDWGKYKKMTTTKIPTKKVS